MNAKTICLLLMLGLVARGAPAADRSLQEQIDEVNAKIKTEEETNQKLKDDIDARDKQIAELRQKLKALEEQTAPNGK